MKWRAVLAVVLLALVAQHAAFAHRIDEYLQATLLTIGKADVQASLRLIPGVLVAASIIDTIDNNHDGVFSEAEQRVYAQRVLDDLSVAVNGVRMQPALVAWNFPQPTQLRDGMGEIHIRYRVEIRSGAGKRSFTLLNQHRSQNSVYLVNALAPQDDTVQIVEQKRNRQQSVYELNFNQATSATQTPWSRIRTWANGVQPASLFRLGMRHIAEGTDHLLFLLVLLLPAPLCVAGTRWGAGAGIRVSLLHIVGIVTAFTIGHSLTLTLAAMGLVHVPGRPVEVLIAVSILVSAVHAFRPVFPGREAWIAGFFGLIHGLAFASTLDRLGLSRWDRVAGVLAFNLGIEAMQMLVVVLVLPSLLLMSGTPYYRYFRVGGATLAGVASVTWITERLLDRPTPIDSAVNGIARHGVLSASALFAASIVCKSLTANRPA